MKKLLLLVAFSTQFVLAQDIQEIDDNVYQIKASIHYKLPTYSFTIYVDTAENSEGMVSAAYKIEVRKGNSQKIIQTIKNFRMLLHFSSDDFQLVDINFDGYLDIMLEYNRGATGNGDAHVWLYRSK